MLVCLFPEMPPGDSSGENELVRRDPLPPAGVHLIPQTLVFSPSSADNTHDDDFLLSGTPPEVDTTLGIPQSKYEYI